MQHLAMIMDGNRRWARKQGFKQLYGQDSKKSVRLAMTFCVEHDIKFLSLYAFSLENFNRSKLEQELIFKLLTETINGELSELVRQGIRIRFIGDRTVFPKKVLPYIENAEEKTKHLDTLHLNLLFCYGGQQEIAHATRSIAEKVKAGVLAVEDINSDTLNQFLWGSELPAPNLIIRTGGAMRLSNFFTYQSAYSELEFWDCFWPEITEEKLKASLVKYSKTQLNFGH